MDLNVLGPLAASEGNISFVPSAAKSKKVLALLMLNAGRIVPIPTLQKELWDENPPRSALTTLQTYILQLRKLLGTALLGTGVEPKDVLVTKSMGYLFRPCAGMFDLEIYQQLSRDAQAAFSRDDYDLTARLLRTALDLWKGDALVDVQIGPVLEGHVLRLEESRVSALEMSIEAELKLGRHHQSVSELTALTTQFPLNENMHAQLMTALHRSGRRGQALKVYQDLRNVLVSDLGLEPSLRLRRLQHAILSCDPRLDLASHSFIAG